jgi:hypothetical protein
MIPRVLERSGLAGLLVIACSLTTTGCLPALGKHAVIVRGGVRLSPDPAFANARIAAVLGESVQDPSHCRFEWRRNGTVIDGVSARELEPSRFARGDRISVRVIPPVTGNHSPALTAETTVENSPPSITRVGIASESAAAGPELRAHVDCVDADGDPPGFEYSWFRNGVSIEGARDENLPATGFTRGDRITVTVVARDGRVESPPASSEPFVIENRAPAFSSQPAAPRAGDSVYEYHAVALDPDGDPLRYELVSGPQGMSVGSNGQLLWAIPTGDLRQGDHPVSIRATDSNGGQAVQQFTIRLDGPASR